MFAKYKWAHCLALFAVCVPVLQGQKKNVTFSLPDSVLLFGTYNDIRIVTPSGVQSLKPPADLKTNGGYFAFPGISPKGNLVAWGFAVALDKERTEHRARYALGIYSTSAREWKTYGDFDDIGATAFSPDGTKIAFVAEEKEKQELMMFDVAAGTMTVWNKATFNWSPGGNASFGWAAGGDRLAIEIQKEGKSVIAVLDLVSGNVQIVGDGYEPAWSPTGEWIAYYAGQKCMLVHPDGTGTKSVKDVGGNVLLRGYRSFNAGLVWSPDGKQLLLNEIKGDGPNLNVMLLDLASGRFSRKSEDSLPVFGWVAQQ